MDQRRKMRSLDFYLEGQGALLELVVGDEKRRTWRKASHVTHFLAFSLGV